MKTVQKIQEELENECYLKETGFTTFAQVEPGGTQNGLGYNASGFDVVVLDNDGRTVAYRYSDDTINDDWTIGDLEDVADADQHTKSTHPGRAHRRDDRHLARRHGQRPDRAFRRFQNLGQPHR